MLILCFQCQRAEPLQKQMITLWKNGVPMSIEVLLYTNCTHGYQHSTSLDFSLLPKPDQCVLLEQWTIQALPRRWAADQLIDIVISGKNIFHGLDKIRSVVLMVVGNREEENDTFQYKATPQSGIKWLLGQCLLIKQNLCQHYISLSCITHFLVYSLTEKYAP